MDARLRISNSLGALVVVVLALCAAGCGSASRRTSTTTTGSTTTGSVSRDVVPDHHWLGLNWNSTVAPGSLTTFSRAGIVWDRGGRMEVAAGATPANESSLATGLRRSFGAGMIPDLVVDPVDAEHGCEDNPELDKLCLPITHAQVAAYVSGFVQTAVAVDRRYPHKNLVLEPMDEPWDWAAPPGTGSGVVAAREYAQVLSRLLPALRSARVPLSRIYIPATGALGDGSQWVEDLYRAQPCLEPGPRSCGPVEAWNVHVYGPPHSTTSSLSAAADLRSEMRSGSDNVIVSELGFCATDVESGAQCEDNTPDVDGSSQTVSAWLRQTLRIGERMHAAGWLRALILWNRSSGGWSMQLPDGALTAQGRTLLAFARTHRR